MERTNQRAIDSFKAATEFLEAHPGLGSKGDYEFYFYLSTKEELKKVVHQIGAAEKVVDDSYFGVRKKFGIITFQWFTSREMVCEKVKVGTKVVPAQAEQVIPAKPERIEDVFEWKCPPSILRDDEDVLLSVQEAVDEAAGKTLEAIPVAD